MKGNDLNTWMDEQHSELQGCYFTSQRIKTDSTEKTS